MKRKNLQALADYLKTLPQEVFDMEDIRTGQKETAECDSVGCVIGHATVLFEQDLPRYISENIDFPKFWQKFSGLMLEDYDSSYWIVASTWSQVDNTPIGASKRIEWLLKHG